MDNKNLEELFKKFQESSTQIDKFNEILEDFSYVLQNLNSNITGVVELTQMEAINENSKKAIENLEMLQKQYASINIEYEKLMSLKMNKENSNDKLGEFKNNVYSKFDKLSKENEELKNLVLKLLKITGQNENEPTGSNFNTINISSSISDLAVCVDDKIYFRNSLDSGNLYRCNKDGKEVQMLTKDHDICNLETHGKTLFYLNKKDGKVYSYRTYKANVNSSGANDTETRCTVEDSCNSFKFNKDYLYYSSDSGIKKVKLNNKDDVKTLFNERVNKFEIIEETIYFESDSFFYKIEIAGNMVEKIL